MEGWMLILLATNVLSLMLGRWIERKGIETELLGGSYRTGDLTFYVQRVDNEAAYAQAPDRVDDWQEQL